MHQKLGYSFKKALIYFSSSQLGLLSQNQYLEVKKTFSAFCGANIGVVDTGFALFLQEKFQLNEFQIGLCFVPSSVSYMLVGFLVGYLTDKR